ncbi:MAG TPA: class I SAM-dependent methyltransferase [Acetobacteraceae bacterium]|jgi:SAM-dependent methyltransferase|nr:class I SAM-dependent methyltransferase [Acetobacteraceae bacterium]
MTQNIYDNPDFFSAYAALPRSREGLEGAPEWPSVRALLPPMRGLRVLDLGCGYGWFCRWAREAGAASITGVDVSAMMLARAAELAGDPAVTYLRADLETFAPSGTFDLAYSSLALHYVVDLGRLFAAVNGALAPGGAFVFTAEHPLFTAPRRPGWVRDAEGRATWPIDSYLIEGPRVTDWLAPDVVKQHRTIGTLLTVLLRAGFVIGHVEEWGPTDAQVAERPALAAERDRPTFLIVAAHKPPNGTIERQ